ncbi:tRNA pseudouridine(38-40) synthase TruA [Alteromonadaceae bacterium BrNp21-10]|nr:tRNA pseudouridine(38-40) synthase TruA [Alteromonadaceae bacterium BrNp21-10]
MRIALGVEYDGSEYHGWQKQNHCISVQEKLESALSQIANQTIKVVCAGRTDSGVHATEQVVHFDVDTPREQRAWQLGVNANLPNNIAVKWAQEVNEDFHARFSAVARRYRYIIYNKPLRTAILPKGLTHVFYDLDVDKMQQAAQCLVGRHDFTTFRANQCQANTAERTVAHIQLSRINDYVILDIQANAFLHHMVRNIAGSLIEIGVGNQPVAWMREVLQAKKRELAGPMAKPHGLYLVKVIYPLPWQLPESPLGPLFLPEKNF